MALSMFMNPFQHPFHASSRSLFTDLEDMLYESPFSHHHYHNYHPRSSPFYPKYSLYDRTPFYYRAPPVRRVIHRRPPVLHVSQPTYLSLIADPFVSPYEVTQLKRRVAPFDEKKEKSSTVINTASSETAAATSSTADTASSTAMQLQPESTVTIANKRPRLSEKLESLWAMKTLSDLTLSADGSAYEMRMQIAPHATVSNVTMQVLRNVQDADRKLQVVIDTETHEEVTLFGSWPMVSESKHSTSRTVSLAADARTEGVTVILEEAKNEKQERELLIKIPREVVTSPTAIATAAETVNAQSTSSDVRANEPVDTANSNVDAAIMPPAFPQVEHEQPEDDAASQNSSEVTVEDVDDNEADNN